MTIVLLLIDPQIDFHEGGSLAVPGATADSERIAQMISEHGEEIDEIYVTLDSHHVCTVYTKYFSSTM
jgi:nicotinamidase-related amidase